MTAAPRLVAVRSGVVRVGGAFVDGAACAAIWPILRAYMDARSRDGGQVRPEVAEAVAALRMAALEHATSADGHGGRTSADMVPPLPQVLTTTTQAMAVWLGVGSRQARRIAAAHGMCPLARDVWATEDVRTLAASRSAKGSPR